MKQPQQPTYRDGEGTIRFHPNAIVRFLLDAGPFDLNKLALMPFSKEDQMQFAQLIGYSLGGYGELSYVTDESYAAAMATAAIDLAGLHQRLASPPQP